MPSSYLREVIEADLDAFFDHQLDPAARHRAAFTSPDPTNYKAFLERWAKILGDDTVLKRTIAFEGVAVGHILRFEQFSEPAVSYWLGKEHWGKGLATNALREFLPLVPERPLYARAAVDNSASLRVLEKCGFAITGSDTDFAPGRGKEVEEAILILRA